MLRKGFSLIEILVVIGIVAVLLKLSLGVSRRVRESARSTRCMANQRQLYLALWAYDSQVGTLPYGSQRYEFGFNPPLIERAGYYNHVRRHWWFQLILERENDYWCESLLECPSKSVNDLFYGNSNVLSVNYGVNHSLLRTPFEDSFYEPFIGRSVSLSRLRRPGETLLLCDSGYTLVSWWHATAEPLELNPPTTSSMRQEVRSYIPGLSANTSRIDIQTKAPPLWDDAVKGRHANKTLNVTFTDGHIDRIAADDLMVTGDPNHYTNQTPLWVP